MAKPSPDKAFPVSWDQFHRDARMLTWRLADKGPFTSIVCITRGGLVPAAIVARELEIKLIERPSASRAITATPARGTEGPQGHRQRHHRHQRRRRRAGGR